MGINFSENTQQHDDNKIDVRNQTYKNIID